MKQPTRSKPSLIRTTLIGGILFLVPVSVFVVVLTKPLAMTKEFVTPLTDRLPFKSLVGLETPVMAAFVLIAIVCFLAGLAARTPAAKKGIAKIENAILSKIPGYEILKSLSESALDAEDADTLPVVILNLDGISQIALLIEENGNGTVTVFVPDAPSPRSGGVFFVPADRVTPLDVPLASAMSSLKRFGAGSSKLLEALPPEPKV